MSHAVSRRTALARMSAAVVAIASPAWLGAQARTRIIVYKDPTCGCCHKWIDHMTANGFAANVTDTDMRPIKAQHRIAAHLESCHTTLVGGYVIEGHVPAADVRKLLALKPKGIVGLTIPGMPASAPGMDLTPFRPYEVLAFDAQGRTSVFARHERP